MTPGNPDLPIFAATLVPHRSLPRPGLLVLLAGIAAAWSFVALYFWSIGAWPVAGFVGLDFAAVLLAFGLSYRSARVREEVEVSRAALVLRRFTPAGRAVEMRFNPRWTRLDVEADEEEGVTRIAIIGSQQARVPVGSFLNPEDRASFAEAFGAALAEARR